ncbi:MAG TPA: hypothetical protein VEF76_01000 [Patescibacteria group bacterium]|nr:hypothetical protein [Patescibacteria group bacterium]
MKKTILILSIALALGACSRTTQTTSGSAYLSQYSSVPVAEPVTIASKDGTVTEYKSIDQRVREAAAVEPVLRFPARIGLARIDGRQLTMIPAEESEAWGNLAKRLGAGYGEFVPVNPMIASMVANNGAPGQRPTDAIDLIRLGAARQHLDAVLIYEVLAKESKRSNILSIANASIIGGYVLPSKIHDAEGLGNALLIDVMQAYPYGTVTTEVEKTRLSSSWGWGSDYDDSQKASDAIKVQAASQLADEAYDMLIELRDQLYQKKK